MTLLIFLSFNSFQGSILLYFYEVAGYEIDNLALRICSIFNALHSLWNLSPNSAFFEMILNPLDSAFAVQWSDKAIWSFNSINSHFFFNYVIDVVFC